MSAKHFVAFPLAALLLGTPLAAPKLKERLPPLYDSYCDYAHATKMYLQAYAYAAENPHASAKFLAAAENERKLCRSNTSPLKLRIESLKKTLFP